MTTRHLIRLFLYVILTVFFLFRFETAIAEDKDCEGTENKTQCKKESKGKSWWGAAKEKTSGIGQSVSSGADVTTSWTKDLGADLSDDIARSYEDTAQWSANVTEEMTSQASEATNITKKVTQDVLELMSPYVTQTINLLTEAGFTVVFISVKVSISPEVSIKVSAGRILGDAEKQALLKKYEDAKVAKLILEGLFLAYDLNPQALVGFEVSGVTVGLVPPPVVTVYYTPRKQ